MAWLGHWILESFLFFFNISAPRPPTEMFQYSMESSDPDKGDGALKKLFFADFDAKMTQKPKNGAPTSFRAKSMVAAPIFLKF